MRRSHLPGCRLYFSGGGVCTLSFLVPVALRMPAFSKGDFQGLVCRVQERGVAYCQCGKLGVIHWNWLSCKRDNFLNYGV